MRGRYCKERSWKPSANTNASAGRAKEHERIAREQGFTDRDRPENSDDPRVRRPLPIVTNEHTNARDPRSPQMARKLFPDNWRD
jgi:hypothetical protein